MRCPISRDTLQGRLALPQNGCDARPPPWYLASHRHFCAIPHFATYRTIIVGYPINTSTKEFCDTIATSIARYEKYLYRATKNTLCNFGKYPKFGFSSRVLPKKCSGLCPFFRIFFCPLCFVQKKRETTEVSTQTPIKCQC